MEGWGLDDKVEREREDGDREGDTGETTKIKSHLRHSMETKYRRNFLKYIYIYEDN